MPLPGLLWGNRVTKPGGQELLGNECAFIRDKPDFPKAPGLQGLGTRYLQISFEKASMGANTMEQAEKYLKNYKQRLPMGIRNASFRRAFCQSWTYPYCVTDISGLPPADNLIQEPYSAFIPVRRLWISLYCNYWSAQCRCSVGVRAAPSNVFISEWKWASSLEGARDQRWRLRSYSKALLGIRSSVTKVAFVWCS